MTKAHYTAQIIEHASSDPHANSRERTILIITDLNRAGGRSVTNDIENVLAECLQIYGPDLPRRIIYRDSESVWDAIDHVRGSFRAFRPIRETDLSRAITRAFLTPVDPI